MALAGKLLSLGCCGRLSQRPSKSSKINYPSQKRRATNLNQTKSWRSQRRRQCHERSRPMVAGRYRKSFGLFFNMHSSHLRLSDLSSSQSRHLRHCPRVGNNLSRNQAIYPPQAIRDLQRRHIRPGLPVLRCRQPNKSPNNRSSA